MLTSDLLPRLKQFFKDDSDVTKTAVSERLTAIATHCNSKTGPIKVFCTDWWGACTRAGVWAYSISGLDFAVICDRSFFDLPPTTKVCREYDIAGHMIHEFSHIETVYSPMTHDYERAYDDVLKLSSGKALLNAESYNLYVNGKLSEGLRY